MPHRLLSFAIAIAFLLTLWLQAPGLADKYRIITDVQNFYWTARAQDPTLFTPDYILMVGRELVEVDFFGQRLFLMPDNLGYSLAVFIASRWLDFIWISKLLAFGLMPLSVIYLFKLGQHLGDELTGLSVSLFFTFFMLASAESMSPTTGLQRAFTVPLLIVFLYYFLKEQYWGAGLMLLVSALIYFPILPLIVLTWILDFSINPKSKIQNPKYLFPLLVGLTLSLITAAFFFSIQAKLYHPYTPTMPLPNFKDIQPLPMMNDPRFQSGGYAPMFEGFPLMGRAGLFDTGADLLNGVLFSLLGGLISQVCGRAAWQRVPRLVWLLLVAGLMMYVASLFFIVVLSSTALYLPCRYSRTSLFVVGLFMVSLNWVDFIQQLPRWSAKNSRAIRRAIFFGVSLGLMLFMAYWILPTVIIPTIALLGLLSSGLLTTFGASMLFCRTGILPVHSGQARCLSYEIKEGYLTSIFIGLLTLFCGGIYLRTLNTPPLNPSPDLRALYQFAATMPKDAMFAGDPDLMTGIPLFSRRSVLIRRLHPQNDYAMLDYFEAKYAESAAPLQSFCQKYQVDYVAFDTTTFSADYLAKKNFFYEPYNTHISQYVTGKANFVLPTLPKIFQNEPLAVVKCRD